MATRRMSISSLLCDADDSPGSAQADTQSQQPVQPSQDPYRASPQRTPSDPNRLWSESPNGYPSSLSVQPGYNSPLMRSHALSGPGRPPILTQPNGYDRPQSHQPHRQSMSPVQNQQLSPTIRPVSAVRSPSQALPPQSPYQEDMGGLAALVHAATQERRRLSGGSGHISSSSPPRQLSESPKRAAERLQSDIPANRSASSQSPVVQPSQIPPRYNASHSPTLLKSNVPLPSPNGAMPSTPRAPPTSNSTESRKPVSSPFTGSNPLFSLPKVQPSPAVSLNTPPTATPNLPPNADSSSSHPQIPAQTFLPPIEYSAPPPTSPSHVKRPSTSTAGPPNQKRRKSSSPESPGNKAEQKDGPRRPGSGHRSHGTKPVDVQVTTESKPASPPPRDSSPPKQVPEPVVSRPIIMQSSSSDFAPIRPANGASPSLPDAATKTEEPTGEVDAHEWLLEHYSETSPMDESKTFSTADIVPPVVEHVEVAPAIKHDDADVEIALMVSELEESKPKAKKSPTPTPQYTAPTSKDEDMDVDVDGALAEIFSELEEKPTPAVDSPVEKTTNADTKMDVDIDGEGEIEVDVDAEVENELLSLVTFSVQPERAARKKKELEKVQEKITPKPTPPAPAPAPVPAKPRAKAKPAKSRAKATTSKAKSSPAPTASGSRAKNDAKMLVDEHTAKPATKIDHRKEEVASEKEDTDQGEENTKLYCVCQTLYDTDKVMIACDRCDEWYHPPCVGMPEDEVEIVDQFICPPCVTSHPELSLHTTYKTRCLRTGCNKAARGSLSKYCSDACGIQTVDSRMNAWGGDKQKLWPQVQNAVRREGVVCTATVDGQIAPSPESLSHARAARIEDEVKQLKLALDEVVEERETIKADVVVIQWRQRAIELATARADRVLECGWDQRLCYGAEEYEEFGDEVLASYEGDEDGEAEDGEWFCRGKHLKCERHAGWQKLRIAEASYEREIKDTTLQKLTTREREVRKRIEDLTAPPPSQAPNGRSTAVNGQKTKKKR